MTGRRAAGPSRCVGCSRAFNLRLPDADGWNVELRAGVPQWIICPDCQSVQQNLEAAINEATLSYSERGGVLFGAPRLGVDDGRGSGPGCSRCGRALTVEGSAGWAMLSDVDGIRVICPACLTSTERDTLNRGQR